MPSTLKTGWRRVASRAIAETYSASRHFYPPKSGFRVLLYHAVGTPVEGDPAGIYNIAPGLFETHMRRLAASRSCEIADIFSGGKAAHGLRVAVTFDDGYKDNLHRAAPLLQELKIPFAVFIATAYTQKSSSIFLGPAEIRELARLPGVTIGAHGKTHTQLTRCDDHDLRNELVESKAYLEDLLGQPVTSMAYPHGAADMRVRNAVQAAGYAAAFCSRFDINAAGRDPLLLCRTDILACDSPRVFMQKIRGDWDWYKWRNRDPAAC